MGEERIASCLTTYATTGAYYHKFQQPPGAWARPRPRAPFAAGNREPPQELRL